MAFSIWESVGLSVDENSMEKQANLSVSHNFMGICNIYTKALADAIAKISGFWEREKTDTQIKETTYGSNYIHLSYNLIDINKYSEQYLLKKDSIFAYCMLIEKANDTKELSKTIKKISKHITEEERLLEIANIVQDLFLSSLEQEEIKIEVEKKVGEKNMLTWAQRIEAGDQKRLKQKEIQVKREIGKRMKENGISIELIEEILQLKIKK